MLNPPARLGAHLLAQQRQQRIPHATLAPAGKGVADLFAGQVVLGQRALSTVSGLAAGGLHVKDGIDHVPGATHPGAVCAFTCRKVLLHNLLPSVMSLGYTMMVCSNFFL